MNLQATEDSTDYTARFTRLNPFGLRVYPETVRRNNFGEIEMNDVDWSKRAFKYGDFVKTYTDKKLFSIMMKGIERTYELDISKACVIDLGCGTGLSSFFLINKVREIIYIDSSMEMVNEGKRRGIIRDNSEIIIHNLNSLPFPLKSGVGDIVIARYVVHDIENKKDLFKEINRILKYGGIFQLVDMYAIDTITKDFYNLIHGWKTLSNDYTPVFIELLSDYEKILAESNFKISEVALYRIVVNTNNWFQEEQIALERKKLIENLTKEYIKNIQSSGPFSESEKEGV